MDERWDEAQGEFGDDGDGARPEDRPGSGVVVAFGKPLKLLREREGLDRAELGSRSGYSASTISSFEQGGGSRRGGSSTGRTRCWGRAES